MKNNKEILKEAFFKKMSYEEKRNKRLAQYTPVDLKNSSGSFNTTAIPGPAYQVTDTEEVKRRLSGTFGVMFGNNSIKSMASRAIKEFPIIVSDAIEPETVLMIKRLVEEQYAEYINLLISNQVVNLADYTAGSEEGNIAIQALDHISGSDFKRSRIADKAARSNSITTDSVFQNIPLYNLLRENQMKLESGESITDALLENAIVIPSDEVQKLVEFIDNYSNEIATLNEDDSPAAAKDTTENPHARDIGKSSEVDEKTTLGKELGTEKKEIEVKVDNDFNGLNNKGTEIFKSLNTADVVIDGKQFNSIVNKTVGEMLARPENKNIKDKFEKATFLLQSLRISGVEYYQYLTQRLGIPVSQDARLALVSRFKIADIRKYGQSSTEAEGGIVRNYTISAAERKAIAENRIYTDKIVRQISTTKLSEVIAASTLAAASGAVATLTHLGILLATPWAPAIVGCAIGGSAYLLMRLVRKLKEKKNKILLSKQKIQGWERVEKLIYELEENQKEINQNYSNINKYSKDEEDFKKDNKEEYKEQGKFKKKLTHSYNDLKNANDTLVNNALREGIELAEKRTILKEGYDEFVNQFQEEIQILREAMYEIALESQDDKMLNAELLTEKVLGKTSMPMTVKYVEKKADKDLMITPTFMARDNYAYGSAEIDKKNLKDRRYNQPLIMTIKFKERFADEKYSDNELTAVIGILGRIIRVPSSEMEYILKEAAEGKTIEGIFNSGNLKDSIADIMSVSKISKNLKNLPQSADIWRNLEKVTTLAAANKISGRRNGNISNAHIIFAQKEIDAVRNETGIDFMKDIKKSILFMKKYSAFTLMIANDAGQRMMILDDQDNTNWNIIPYSALTGKDSGDQLNAALTKMMRL